MLKYALILFGFFAFCTVNKAQTRPIFINSAENLTVITDPNHPMVERVIKQLKPQPEMLGMRTVLELSVNADGEIVESKVLNAISPRVDAQLIQAGKSLDFQKSESKALRKMQIPIFFGRTTSGNRDLVSVDKN